MKSHMTAPLLKNHDNGIYRPPLPLAGEGWPALGVAGARPGGEGGYALGWVPPHLYPLPQGRGRFYLQDNIALATGCVNRIG
jgi:hypothetical protein